MHTRHTKHTPARAPLTPTHTQTHPKMHDTIGHVRVSFWPLLRQCPVCCAILATYTCVIGCVLGWQCLIASLNSWFLLQKNRTKTGHLCRKKKFGEPDNRCHPISAYPLSQTNPLHDTVLLLLAHSWPKVRVLLSPVLCLSTRELARTHTHMMMHVRTHARPIRDLQQYFTDVSPLPCVCKCERESSVFCSNISPTCITSTGSVSA